MDEIRIYLVLSSQVLMNYQRKPFNISIPISILQFSQVFFPNFPPFAGTSTNGGSPIAGWFLLWKIDLQLDDLGSTPWPPASVARPPPPQDPAARGPAGPAPWRPAASGLGAPPRRHGEGGPGVGAPGGSGGEAWKYEDSWLISSNVAIFMANRRKFRSQTSDNMDRWKAEMGRVREQKRREEKRRDETRREEKRREEERERERERVRRKKIQVPENVGKLRNTVFFQWFEAPEGPK